MKKLSIPIISAIAIAVAVISIVLRIICLFSFYDSLGYYQTGAPLPIITNVLTVITIIFFLVCAILCVTPKDKIGAPNKIAGYASLLPLGTLIFVTVQLVKELSTPATDPIEQSNFIPLVMLLSAIVSIVFFLLIFLSNFSNKLKLATVYCGLSALIFVFFAWMSTYFDFSSPINSTQRTLFYVSCAGAMIFIFNEMCAIYGSVKPKFYYFSLFATILAISSSAIPSLVGSAADKFNVYFNEKEDIFLTALLVYATVRLITLLKSQRNTDEKAIESADTSASC